jgi:hypothetical protein
MIFSGFSANGVLNVHLWQNIFQNFFRLQYYCWICGGDARATNIYVKRTRPDPSFTCYYIRFFGG